MSRVSLIKDTSRRAIARRSLELIADDVARELGGRQPVIKLNFVSSTVQLASSHVDQVRGILDVFSDLHRGTIIIAEAACYDTQEAFRNFGYLQLQKEYDVELVDLNAGPSETCTINDRRQRAIPFRLSRLMLDKDKYFISAAKLKTHDTVVVTLSIKNMAVGCVVGNDKSAVHQGARQTNCIIAGLAGRLRTDLAVIDGFEGMEGDGPTQGDPVRTELGIASIDALAADRVACEIMGVRFDDVGYLHYCAGQGMGESELDRIDVLGARLCDCIRPFKLHRSVEQQYACKQEE